MLANWAQLQSGAAPAGGEGDERAARRDRERRVPALQGAAGARRAVGPGITIDACARHEVAAGVVDRRVLAVLAFLSRSGLEPTVSALRCSQRQCTPAMPRLPARGDEVDISAINGTPIAGHQGPETITDLTIRALLTLPAGFVPHEIDSLMRYPGSPNTHAASADWNRIHLEFRRRPPRATLNPAATATAAHSARSGRTAPAPLVTTSALSAAQWSQLMQRVAALPVPTIASQAELGGDPGPEAPARQRRRPARTAPAGAVLEPISSVLSGTS